MISKMTKQNWSRIYQGLKNPFSVLVNGINAFPVLRTQYSNSFKSPLSPPLLKTYFHLKALCQQELKINLPPLKTELSHLRLVSYHLYPLASKITSWGWLSLFNPVFLPVYDWKKIVYFVFTHMPVTKFFEWFVSYMKGEISVQKKERFVFFFFFLSEFWLLKIYWQNFFLIMKVYPVIVWPLFIKYLTVVILTEKEVLKWMFELIFL